MRSGQRRQHGQSIVEYALILAFVALSVIAAIGWFQGKTNNAFVAQSAALGAPTLAFSTPVPPTSTAMATASTTPTPRTQTATRTPSPGCFDINYLKTTYHACETDWSDPPPPGWNNCTRQYVAGRWYCACPMRDND